MSDAALRCSVEQESTVMLVRVDGPLTPRTAPILRATVFDCLSSQPKLIVADVSAMNVEDDIVLTVLPALARHAAAWPGAGLALGAPGHRLAAALDRMAVCRYVPVFSTVEQAVAAAADPIPCRAINETLRPTPAALATGRSMVAWACAAWNVPALAETARVIMTELLANTVRHARTPVDVRVSLRQRHLHLSVHDRSPAPARLTGPDHDHDPAGRGLLVVEALAAAWGNTPTAEGKVVWATLMCPPGTGTQA
jgi:hypothetical protein